MEEFEGIEVVELSDKINDIIKPNIESAKINDSKKSDSSDSSDSSASSEKSNLDRTLTEQPGLAFLPCGSIHYRKWKVKDKKNIDAAENTIDLKKALVLNCIEENVVLDNEEFNYVLFRIRNDSIHDKLKYTFVCPHCHNIEEFETELSKITKTEGDYNITITIKTDKEYVIKFGCIRNSELYLEAVNDKNSAFQNYINDMIMHIHSINDSSYETRDDYAQLVEFIDNLDSDVADNLLIQWEDCRYKLVIDDEITCKVCGSTTKFDYSSTPGFFPDSWNM